MGLHSILLELHPETVYEGTVYEQRAVLESPEGVAFGVFDPDLILEEALVGEEVVLEVSLLVARGGVATVSGAEPGIVPNPDDPTGWAHHRFVGRVVDVVARDEYFYQVSLDVGCGAVWFLLERDEYERPRVGVTMEVAAGRTDVAGLGDEVEDSD